MFLVNKNLRLVFESFFRFFNCVMGDFVGFLEIMNVSGNFFFLFSV